ncbi:cold shock domain-containing protein [Picosynechococcus sp. PCC 73109]|uniref:cold shock domain-containing protein n=1 Tax=Picosynechococcus sp. PCC 73109 TaxID=374982 RepID=UPI0007459546|nr:cold shock domain-containing protein [Picosynechococcus sp. PCC 73109]AMA07927.1 hypothetical protein AWQ23_00545 [Picosynechococcus sp. PCC 73109]
MNNNRYKGRIIKWKEDKGFGFLRSDSLEKDVFLHISEIQDARRSPKVGNILYFNVKLETQGKLKAINASYVKQIQTKSKLFRKNTTQITSQKFPLNIVALLPKAGILLIVFSGLLAILRFSERYNCVIKGNISHPSGEKLYHKPGYRDYEEVDIFENEGEQWFCSEQEAINAGFKDAARLAN